MSKRHRIDICGILNSTIPPVHTPPYPSDALDYIARRLISTQAVRDSKDRYAAHGRFSRLRQRFLARDPSGTIDCHSPLGLPPVALAQRAPVHRNVYFQVTRSSP